MAAIKAASTKPPKTPVHGRVKLVALVNGKSGGKQVWNALNPKV